MRRVTRTKNQVNLDITATINQKHLQTALIYVMDWAFCAEWDGLIANVLELYLWGPVRNLICKHRWLVWKQRPDSNGEEEIFCDDRWKQHSLIKLCLMEDVPDHKHARLRTSPLLHNGELCLYEPTAFYTAILFRRLPFPIQNVTMKKQLSLKG